MFPDTQLPGEGWVVAEPSACPYSLFSVPVCGVDAGSTPGVDSGLVDSGENVSDAAVGVDAMMTNADAALSDAAHD
jgi:hypothetical protein